MKKILMLGGSSAQVGAIKHAKKMGLHVILCDYLPDNPGQHFADEFFPLSTTDERAVLDLARKKSIDGIVAYASDPAAPTAAYVGNALELPSNPYKSVLTLCRKDLFRDFLRKNGFRTPSSASFAAVAEAHDFFQSVGQPCLVKPVDSSGSKGVSIVHDVQNMESAFSGALTFSRAKKVIVEEFVEQKYPFILGGDGFVVDGRMEFHCLMNCHRDRACNPLVPVGKSFPSVFSSAEVDSAVGEINRALDLLGIKMGALNLEVMFDSGGKPLLLEIGPRNGGNLIPEQIGFIAGVDMIDMTIRSAMGMGIDASPRKEPQGCIASHVIHSRRNGILRGITFSPWLKAHVIHQLLYKKTGDPVERLNGANQAIGIIMMKFDDSDQMHRTLENIYEEHISLSVE